MSNPKLVKQLEKDTDPAQFNIDNAFLKACVNCGIDPIELKGKSLDNFQKKGTPEDVAIRRFNNHQNARVRKLYLVVSERKRLLADEEQNCTAVKSPRRQEQTKKKSEEGEGAGEDDNEGDQGEEDGEQKEEEEGDSKKEVKEPKKPSGSRGSGRSRNSQKKGTEAGDDTSQAESQKAGGNLKDMMVERARRQRQQWDLVNERHEKSRQVVEEQRQKEMAASTDFAEKYRRKREQELDEKKMLNEMNQQQMKKRWVRDEELAEKRQQRIDGDFVHRFELYENHASQILRAREKRDLQLMQTAREDSDQQTSYRLERARKAREADEEARREKAQARVDAVQEQRRIHVYEKFVLLTKQNEKALHSREHTQEVLDRAERHKESRKKLTLDRIDEVDDRGSKRQEDIKKTKEDEISKKLVKREESHKTARERRRQLAEEQMVQREKLDEERSVKHAERKKRHDHERTLVAEDAAAKDEHHQYVLKRVARVAEAQQETKQKNFEARQQNHSNRVKQLHEIRRILE